MRNENELLKTYIPIVIFGFLCLTSVGLTNVVGLKLTILFSILYLFIESKRNKRKMEDIGFIPKNILSDIKKYWWLILIPVVSGIVSISLFKFVLPEVYLYASDTKPMLSFGNLFLQIPKLLILAFVEEIAFRGFFQAKLCNTTKPIWAIIITSLFFAIGNFSAVPILGLIYISFFIFIDNIIYGVIYQKTKNIYSCTISHFLANVIGTFILLLI
ncbi:CPBP family intramembrane glutamic endopeptidase [Clostridium estertheticum]|uniref:CPBP family intramembrane metalloprotease n=1 Tax=Clostridium estertheticum TaxID=238834 RepID=A0AA47I7H2_9CLOT|nr:type II CAAX endopeptidase family protein [Clostridium estertheticum]MBU3156886.1 CPBP family intramembrane metalloprotease [Clostridium estertheticum]WAG62632.1 CPBP family intramembrane metalloprotease [Clostridium estertheticum]